MFAEPFDLLKLPKFSGSSHTNIPVICNQDCLFLGISGSSVNKLTVLPPQVLSAHSVAPGTVITSILANDTSLKAYATSERGKFYLKLLNVDDENSNKVAVTKEIEEEVSAMYLSADRSRIATVGKETSQVKAYSADDLELISNEKGIEHGTMLHTNQLYDESTHETMFTVLCGLKSGLSLRTFVVDAKGSRSLITATLENFSSTSSTEWSHYDNYLYGASTESVCIYRIPDGSLVSSFELENGLPVTGLIALPHNNIVIARGNDLELIDCTYQSKVSVTKISGKGSIKLLSHSAFTSTIVALRNEEVLVGLSVTPTTGTLLESIAKGSARKTQECALTDIFGGFTESPLDYKSVAESQIQLANAEFAAVVTDLQSSIANKDGPGFSRVVTYLKNPRLSWSQNREEISAPIEQDLVYEESDRVVDHELIKNISKLAFMPRFKPFLPIGVALYLLTHPLFPIGDPSFKNLLKVLEKSDSILYRQALVSLTGLTVGDLVIGLLSLDEPTFLDAATRIQEDFSTQQILQGVRKAFAGMQSMSSLSIIIERLSRYPETVGLIGPFIDAMGLLAWDITHINKLRAKISENIAILESFSKADSVITDLFDNIGVDPSASSLPSAAELQNRSQKKSASRSENNTVSKYTVETLVL